MYFKTKDRHFWLFQNFHFPFSVMVSLVQYQQMKILLITWPPEKRFYLKCTGIGYESISQSSSKQTIKRFLNPTMSRQTEQQTQFQENTALWLTENCSDGPRKQRWQFQKDKRSFFGHFFLWFWCVTELLRAQTDGCGVAWSGRLYPNSL